MIVVGYNQAQLNGAGLNGWFGRFLKNRMRDLIELVVRTVPIVGEYLGKGLEKLTDSLIDFNTPYWNKNATTTDYEPTAAEQSVLTPWIQNKFTPFYQSMSMELAGAFSNANINVQLQIINSVAAKICVSKIYLATNDTAGLTIDGIKARNEFVKQAFTPLEEIIAKSIAQHDTVIDFLPFTYTVSTSGAAQFRPLIANLTGSYGCRQYVNTGKKKVTSNVKTPVNDPGQLIDDDMQPIGTSPNTPGTVPTTQPGTTNQPTDKDDKKGMINLLLIGLAFYGLIKLAK